MPDPVWKWALQEVQCPLRNTLLYDANANFPSKPRLPSKHSCTRTYQRLQMPVVSPREHRDVLRARPCLERDAQRQVVGLGARVAQVHGLSGAGGGTHMRDSRWPHPQRA